MKILAYCHSQIHEEREGLKIINKLKIHKDDEIDTCDLYGNHQRDIKIDLSKTLLTDDIKQFNRYDIIYLVNCPTHVYIKGEDFNEDLFRNLLLLLSDNGIIITRISINAYKKLTDIELYDIGSIKEMAEMTAIQLVRSRIYSFLIEKGIYLTLLDMDENKNYIKSGINSSNKPHTFFILKKYL